jgi:pilus assembly protein CpaB
MNQKIIPIVSVAVGISAFFLTGHYIRIKEAEVVKEWERLRKAYEKTSIMVATHDIPIGTRMMATDITTNEVYKTLVPSEAVTIRDARQILGRKTIGEISKGDIVSWLDIEGGASLAGLAPIIKPGMRALSLPIGGSAAVSSMIQPNDRVDILGTFSLPSKTRPAEMETVTLTILQDVTVLATGQTLAKDRFKNQGRTRSSGYSTVTVEVTPSEAELLVFAEQMKSRMTLALRNPKDIDFKEQLPEVNFEYLQKELPQMNIFRQYKVLRKDRRF